MKRFVQLMLVLLACMIAIPAYAGGSVHMWRCEVEDGVSEEDVRKVAKTWLTAAKKVDGGQNLNAYVLFPIAVNNLGQMDVMFVVTAPSLGEWGTFWDNYGDSEAADIESSNDATVCPDSALWESFQVE